MDVDLRDDPNRPGLVGLQFVRFAETEDFWFDPDRDYVLMERIRVEHQVTPRRESVKELGQTSAGLWYPRVIEVESMSPGPAGVPERPLRRERRVLFDGRSVIDDAIFDPATLVR